MSAQAAPVPMPHEPPFSRQLARDHGLSEAEVDLMLSLLGREPTFTELGVFSVMWSEHCSYKSSRVHLRRLPTRGACVVQGPGENAGVVDIGHGHVAVFKMESHNHPSYVEPTQGAATGVGGIMRDVFTMGARPIANVDALRFGAPSHPRTRYLVSGVVSGIGGYGNCMGVPTVGGEVTFNPCYDGNILVNAFTLGIARREGIFLGRAEGVGHPVFYVGSRTGRDGIHGASLLASAEFDDTTDAKRPTVQVGDPFTEKLLLEACLEAMATGAIAGIQDMGAAGLTCSTCEMAGRAGRGMDLDLDCVPLRERGMTPYEIMLSESQERMLLVAHPGREKDVLEVFRKWDLEVAQVGVVTDTGRLVVRAGGRVVADLPAAELSEKAPVHDRPRARPAWQDDVVRLDPASIPQPEDLSATLATLVASPNLCSREWVWTHYDWSVRTNTIEGPGGDAAVVRVKETGEALAIKADCNPRYCFLDPREGAKQAVAEAARGISCVGGEPLAVTDCMNFGNPEKPAISWQFSEAVDGLTEACVALGTPIVSGNVSFYNETDGRPIHPTPAVVVVGLVPDPERVVRSRFAEAGDHVVILGEDRGEIGGSEYLWVIHGREAGLPPRVDLDAEKRLGAFLREGARSGRFRSAHDVSDGGLAVALAECAFRGRAGQEIGCRIELPPASPTRDDVALFSETQGRAVVTVTPGSSGRGGEEVVAAARAAGVPAHLAGTVGGDRLVVTRSGRAVVDVSVGRLREEWERGFVRHLEGAERGPGA